MNTKMDKKPNVRKIIIISCIVLIAISLAFSIYINNNVLKHNVTQETILNLPVSINYMSRDMSPESINLYNQSGVSLETMYEESDLVVLVERTEQERKIKENLLLSNAKVKRIFKNDCDRQIDEIYVYEWAAVGRVGGRLMYGSDDTYNIMDNGSEYILFLKHRVMPEGFEYSPVDLDTYLLTNVYFGKISINMSDKMYPTKTDSDIGLKEDVGLYSNIKDWDIVPYVQADLDNYKRMREEVFTFLGL